jgi:Zn-dependent M28 family amino/carboxypeptidase
LINNIGKKVMVRLSKYVKIFAMLLLLVGVFIFGLNIINLISVEDLHQEEFSGQRALDDVKYQVDLGSRTLGSDAHVQVEEWIISELEEAGWEVEIRESPWEEYTLKNIVAHRGDESPEIIIGAHYDSRFFADQDPIEEYRRFPVPGANDGASGVAVLLELARVLPLEDKNLWLVFFDGEDNGKLSGWDWILGSSAFVNDLTTAPGKVIVVDMIGDKNLNIHYEASSDKSLSEEIWEVAAELGYSEFVPEYRYSIIDDHTPFIIAGIPAVLIIDFDYPYWHTLNDTIDKVSARSLEIVGRTLYNWLISDD